MVHIWNIKSDIWNYICAARFVNLGEGCVSDLSNPNHRPIHVISFLAAHPQENFTLAEIARHLDLSKGSAHRVMAALTETGFAARHPRHKTYSLGMALVGIGQAALEKYPGIQIARREMIRLCAELNVGCGAAAVVNQEFLLLGREGAPETQDGLTLVGERRMLVPPIGICHMAWRDKEQTEAYLDRGAAYLSDDARNHLRAAFPAIRNRGYSIAANGPGMRWLRQSTIMPLGFVPEGSVAAPTLEEANEISLDEFQLLDLASPPALGVNYISAPVFSSEGDVCLEIVISGLPANLNAEGIERYATRLCRAAEIVTNETRGRRPRLG